MGKKSLFRIYIRRTALHLELFLSVCLSVYKYKFKILEILMNFINCFRYNLKTDNY